ncbi:MAG: T9SS type A sorting domain-containing protein [Bacteroidetes bacterium]|nr:T9SS type A sorting domain-containing protein [Bacteroidota bacterium]
MKKIYLFFGAGLACIAPVLAQNPSTNLDSALIACFPFNGNALDGTGNGNNGTVNGATLVSDRFGNSNAAYSFNGSSNNISISNFNTKITSDEFSLSFWATSTLYATRSPFLLVPDDANNRLNVHIYYGNQLSNSQTFFDWGNISNGRLYIAGSPLPAAGTWDNWVFTTSAVNANMKCYKNGTLQFTKSGNGNLITSTGGRDLLIGGGLGVNSSYLWFNGSIDDVKLYNRVLTQNDVNALYTQTITCKGAVTGNNQMTTESNEFLIYPNPSNARCVISNLSNGISEVNLLSISGELLISQTSSKSEIELDLKDLSRGIYFVSIKNSKGTTVKKVIKE